MRQFVLREGTVDPEDLPAIISVLKVAAALFIKYDSDATGDLSLEQVMAALTSHGYVNVNDVFLAFINIVARNARWLLYDVALFQRYFVHDPPKKAFSPSLLSFF